MSGQSAPIVKSFSRESFQLATGLECQLNSPSAYEYRRCVLLCVSWSSSSQGKKGRQIGRTRLRRQLYLTHDIRVLHGKFFMEDSSEEEEEDFRNWVKRKKELTQWCSLDCWKRFVLHLSLTSYIHLHLTFFSYILHSLTFLFTFFLFFSSFYIFFLFIFSFVVFTYVCNYYMSTLFLSLSSCDFVNINKPVIVLCTELPTNKSKSINKFS